MTTTAVATKTRRPAAKKAVEVKPTTFKVEAAGVSLDLEQGTYKKVGRIRIGKAFLSVGADGSLTYTNRRGERRYLVAKEFVQIWKTGINSKVA